MAEMSKVQNAEPVLSSSATPQMLTEGFLASSHELRNAGRDDPPRTDAPVENTAFVTDAQPKSLSENPEPPHEKVLKKRSASQRKKKARSAIKPRFGLPEGFTPRMQQHGRSVLLEDNVYALPSGQQFIPRCPTGTLGQLRHLYALLTVEQFQGGRRGSIYLRNDGRIFDYSVDHADPSREMFDTGYTISDLKRTGKYAPEAGSKKGKQEDAKLRRVAQAG